MLTCFLTANANILRRLMHVKIGQWRGVFLQCDDAREGQERRGTCRRSLLEGDDADQGVHL